MVTTYAWAVDTAVAGSPQPAIPSAAVRYLVALSDTETWPAARARLAAGVNPDGSALVFITAEQVASGYTVRVLEATAPIEGGTGGFVPEGFTPGTYNAPETGTSYNGKAFITTYAQFP